MKYETPRLFFPCLFLRGPVSVLPISALTDNGIFDRPRWLPRGELPTVAFQFIRPRVYRAYRYRRYFLEFPFRRPWHRSVGFSALRESQLTLQVTVRFKFARLTTTDLVLVLFSEEALLGAPSSDRAYPNYPHRRCETRTLKNRRSQRYDHLHGSRTRIARSRVHRDPRNARHGIIRETGRTSRVRSRRFDTSASIRRRIGIRGSGKRCRMETGNGSFAARNRVFHGERAIPLGRGEENRRRRNRRVFRQDT